MMKTSLWCLGVILAVIGLMSLMLMDKLYAKEIDKYNKCDSVCFRENGTVWNCDCKEVIETSSATPKILVITSFSFMIVGMIILIWGWVGESK